MLHLTARFHLQLQMSTNERGWMELFGMEVSEGINQPATAKQSNYYSILKKNTSTFLLITTQVTLNLLLKFICPYFLNGDKVCWLSISIHFKTLNTLSCGLLQLDHVFASRTQRLCPWSRRRDTWPKLNWIKRQSECIFHNGRDGSRTPDPGSVPSPMSNKDLRWRYTLCRWRMRKQLPSASERRSSA